MTTDKERVLRHYEEHMSTPFYPSDVATALELDAAVVRDIAAELIAEGKIEASQRTATPDPPGVPDERAVFYPPWPKREHCRHCGCAWTCTDCGGIPPKDKRMRHEHDDLPDYRGNMVATFTGKLPDDLDENDFSFWNQPHAVIHRNDHLIVTVYECRSFVWHAHFGTLLYGPKEYMEDAGWQLVVKTLNAPDAPEPVPWGHALEERPDRWHGAFLSLQAAIADGRQTYEGDFFVQRGRWARTKDLVPDAEDFLETVRSNAYDSIGEVADYWPDLGPEKQAEVQSHLNAIAAVIGPCKFWHAVGEPERIKGLGFLLSPELIGQGELEEDDDR